MKRFLLVTKIIRSIYCFSACGKNNIGVTCPLVPGKIKLQTKALRGKC